MLLTPFVVLGGDNADDIMTKALSKLKSSKGIEATYTLIGRNISKQRGSIKVSGSKFILSHPLISTWYDGKTQWNYNSETNEVTISSPEQSEIQMVNPYAIVSGYKSDFTSSLIKSKIKGTYCILLKSKNKNSAISKAYLYLKTKDYTPVRVDVISDNNSTTSIVITNYKTGLNFSPSIFVFQTKKYPNVKIVDLR